MFAKKIFLKNSFIGYLSIALLCLPLFFINVRNSSDWGDDFSQYIHQTKNIVNGIPQSETGFLYNEDVPDISIVPNIGFPLLLSPVYYFCGNDLAAFSLFISFSLYILSLALMCFYKKYFSPLIAVFLTLIIVYNPWTMDFKSEILSDIPFTLLLMLSVNLFLTKGINSPLNSLAIGIMAGCLISIRSIGVAFPLALLCHFIKTFFQTADKNNKIILIKNNLIMAATAAGLYLVLNKLLFTASSHGIYLYVDRLSSNIGSTCLTNLNDYFSFIHTFFRGLGRYEFLKTIASSLAVVSLLTGVIYKYKEKIDFIDFLVMIYVLIILVWPAFNYRYLLPIIPFLMYYIVIGLQKIDLKININKNVIISFFGIFVLLQYYPEVRYIIKHQDEIKNGPQEAASVNVFNYIKKNTPKNSVIVFAKPRALTLYTDRTCMANEATDDLEKLRNKFKKVGANYFLISTEVTTESTLKRYADKYKEEVSLVWSNEKFFLYKII